MFLEIVDLMPLTAKLFFSETTGESEQRASFPRFLLAARIGYQRNRPEGFCAFVSKPTGTVRKNSRIGYGSQMAT